MEVGSRPVPLTVGDLDRDVDVLRAHAETWARLGIAGKIRHLRAMRAHTIEVAQRWVDLAARAKAIARDAARRRGVALRTVHAADRDRPAHRDASARSRPAARRRSRTRRSARATTVRSIVDVFPGTRADRILMNGVRAEVWMEPHVTRENLREHIGAFYRVPAPEGRVTLVLGAGNVASIPPLDVLYALFAHGSVAILKLNPVNAYLEPVFARIFLSLVDEGFVRIVEGGADVGAYLVAHPEIDAIHLTGGEAHARRDRLRQRPRGRRAQARRRAAHHENGHERAGQRDARDRRARALERARSRVSSRARRDAEAAQRRRELHRRADARHAGGLAGRRRGSCDAVRAALVHAPARTSYYPGSAHREHAAAECTSERRAPRYSGRRRLSHLRPGARSGEPRRAAVPRRSVRAGPRANRATGRGRCDVLCATP